MAAGCWTGDPSGEVEMYGSGCLYGQSGPRRQFGHARHGVCAATVERHIGHRSDARKLIGLRRTDTYTCEWRQDGGMGSLGRGTSPGCTPNSDCACYRPYHARSASHSPSTLAVYSRTVHHL